MTTALRVDPDALVGASAELTALGDTVRSTNAVTAARATAIAPAGADAVSGAVAALFGAHGAALSTSVARFGAGAQDFSAALHASAAAYAGAEAGNAASLGALTGLLGLFQTDPLLVLFTLPLLVGFGVTILLPYVIFELLGHLLAALAAL